MLGVLLVACDSPSQPTSYTNIDGTTMGTSYHIRFEAPKDIAIADIKARIDERLDAINASMSTYQPDSTISRFNTLKAGQTINIDPDFIRVLDDSRLIYDKSNHAFDPTVYPLVELWGFGASMSVERLQNPPSNDEIQAVRDTIGLDKITLNGNELSKSTDGVGLDFSAIAKGYGVDVIAQVLHAEYQVKNYMVEIGGEVATLGVNDKGKAWTLAIDKPILDSTVKDRQIMTTINLSGQSIATSGNYRNSLEYNGERYSHTINPHTAHPVAGGVPSVSVIADTTATADGWATALTALPQDQAIALADQAGIMALFIVPKPNTTDEFELIKSQSYQTAFP